MLIEKILLSITLIVNCLAFIHTLMSIWGELTINDDQLWEIESFKLALKYFYPLLSLGLTIPLMIYRRK